MRAVLDLYLQDLEPRANKSTLNNHLAYFKSFNKTWPGLLVSGFRPAHVTRWWAKNPSWGASSQRLSGAAVNAALRGASAPGKGGIIPNNPLDGMSLPSVRKKSAEVAITQEEFNRFMSFVKTEAIRDIVIVAWETGTRPINLSRATAANVVQGTLVFDSHNTAEGAVHKTHKKTGRALQVPLPKASQEIVQRLAKRNPAGPLFLSPRGLPWTDVLLATTFRHYARKAGSKGRFTPYSCRHSRATILLESGASDADVAAILGNTPDVLHSCYSHVVRDPDRLRQIMERATKT